MSTLQDEVSRLHERLAPSVTPTRSRDLFRFSRRAPEPPRPAAAVATPDTAPAPPQPPPLTLIGIAEDAQPGGVVRTAIVSGLGDLFLVKAGDLFGGRYRVDQVSSDAVQLTDTTSAVSSTLALR